VSEIASGFTAFVLLCASAGLGILLRPRLPEHHRARETQELMQITIGLLVTFAALVLGLVTASVKQAYDNAKQSMTKHPARHLIGTRSRRGTARGRSLALEAAAPRLRPAETAR
jgi:hypothetical protein